MIAKQTVFLNATRDKAVPEFHEDARSLLVRAGSEVDENVLSQYEDAEDLVNSEAKEAKQAIPPLPKLKDQTARPIDREVPAPELKSAKNAGRKAAKKKAE